MSELIRDTVFGHFLRLLTRGKVLPYPEDNNPDYWKKYVHHEKTARVAKHGQTEEPDEDEKKSQDENESKPSEKKSSELIGGDQAEDFGTQTQHRPSPASVDSGDTYASKTNDLGHRIDPEKGKDLNIIHFDGDSDTEDPRNWSLFKKVFVTALICLLTTSIYIGSAIYTPGLMEITMIFGVSQVAATLGLTLFVAGYGIGPMIFAPLSEIPQIGRNPIYIGTLLVFVVFQLGVIYAKNFGMLLAFRFLTGFFGSPVLATGGASIGDMWRPQKRAYPITIWGLFAVAGPTMGPVVGGFAAQYKGWTWTIWELMWLSGFTLIVLILFLPETSSANILYRRSRRLRVLTGNEKLTSEPELAAADMTGQQIAMIALVRPITLNFTEPMVFLLNLYIALIYGTFFTFFNNTLTLVGLLYVWFESFNIVFSETYGFSVSIEGLTFLGIFVGAVAVIPPFFYYLHKYVEPKFNENGELKPEHRLPAACVGSFFIPICLFWFGWSAGNTHWIMPIIGSAFFSMGAILLFNSVLNYLPDAYPEYAASVLAGNDFFRSMFGAGFPLFASAMYNNLGTDWASSTLGFLAIAFIPIPFVLWKYGEKIRKMSKHARKDF